VKALVTSGSEEADKMSTIGFGLSTKLSSDELKERVLELTAEYGYLVSFDLSVVESEVLEGIKAIKSALELNLLFLLHAPPRPDVALAFDIVEEMRNIDHGITEPKFFLFLKKLSSMLKSWAVEYTVFFADEWNTDLRVRKMEGSVDALIEILTRAGGWHLLLFNPKHGWWEEFEEFPLVFTVKLQTK
jgi:hypothetical protein